MSHKKSLMNWYLFHFFKWNVRRSFKFKQYWIEIYFLGCKKSEVFYQADSSFKIKFQNWIRNVIEFPNWWHNVWRNHRFSNCYWFRGPYACSSLKWNPNFTPYCFFNIHWFVSSNEEIKLWPGQKLLIMVRLY